MNNPGMREVVDPRLRMVVAVLYVLGLALMIIGSVGGFLWVPLLWCVARGVGNNRGRVRGQRWAFLTDDLGRRDR